MTHRQIGFALFATLIALMIGSRELIAYHWQGLNKAQKWVWFLSVCTFFLFVTYWLAKPVIKYLL